MLTFVLELYNKRSARAYIFQVLGVAVYTTILYCIVGHSDVIHTKLINS